HGPSVLRGGQSAPQSDGELSRGVASPRQGSRVSQVWASRRSLSARGRLGLDRAARSSARAGRPVSGPRRRTPGGGFVMSQSAMAWALRRRGLGSSQKFVLVLLADSGNHEGQCLIGKRQLSELAALAEPELTGVLAML